jgi:hypothetical protein
VAQFQELWVEEDQQVLQDLMLVAMEQTALLEH